MSRLPGIRVPSERAAAEGPFFDQWTAANARSVPDVDRERRARRRRLTLGGGGTVVVLAAAAATALLPGTNASADPSSSVWHQLRMCESSNNYSINTGNGYYGAYQFDLGTWRSVGGTGYPNRASSAEQDARALMLYRMRGWQPWTCAGILGLREDSDARSGRVGDITLGRVTTRPPVSTRPTRFAVPAFPGSRWYHYGDDNPNIKMFQDEMHRRGFFPLGTGQYGPNTLRMVKQLQRLNGLVPNGYIGPNTWRKAWTGRYTAPAATPTTPAPVRPKPKPARPARPAPAKPRPAAAIPAFPGVTWYRYGDTSPKIKMFQDEMHKRGFFPAGTGQYGPHTLAMVKRLQRLNGLIPNGLIGPKTWRMAWTGKYTMPK